MLVYLPCLENVERSIKLHKTFFGVGFIVDVSPVTASSGLTVLSDYMFDIVVYEQMNRINYMVMVMDVNKRWCSKQLQLGDR